jgi:hypothetical protein
LHEKGCISEPHGKAKSVVFTEEGLEQAKHLLNEMFGKDTRHSTSQRGKEIRLSP